MPHHIFKAFALSACVALTACGGSGAGHTAETMTVSPLQRNSGTARLGYNPATGALNSDGTIVSIVTSIQKVGGSPNIVTPNILEASYTVRSNDNEVYAFAYATNGLANGTSGLLYGRAVTAELPTTGTATLNGEYRGLLVVDQPTNDNRDLVDNFVSGDVAMNINFGDGIVSGRISERRLGNVETGNLYTNPNATFFESNDVILQESRLDDNGLFAGTTAGGGLRSNSYTSPNRPGTYAGAVGQTSAAGVFKMDTTPLTTEIGAFYTQ